jgi:hypothetical protein
MRRALAALVLAVSVAAGVTSVAAATRLAVVEFVLLDTSNEPIDRRAAHGRRLELMSARIRSELGQDQRFTLTGLAERTDGASAQPDPERLMDEARKDGADLALFGAVQKLSTLVLFFRLSVIDLQTRKLIFDRSTTFRGDNDEAWERAASFVAAQLKASDLAGR